AGLPMPQGDPATLRQTAQQLAGFGDALEQAATDLEAVAARSVEEGWIGPAARAFLLLVQSYARSTDVAAEASRGASAALSGFAAHLQHAQDLYRSVETRATLGSTALGEIDPELAHARASAREAIAEAQMARATAAAEIAALARMAPALPGEGGRDGIGGWLRGELDRLRHDPAGAAVDWGREWLGGLGQGATDLAAAGALVFKLTPGYGLLNPDDQARTEQGLGAA